MPVSSDGWLDWAERVPGPADKVYRQPNAAAGYVPHSAVGYYDGWTSRLLSNERTGSCVHGGVHLAQGGDYTKYAAASVHLWIEQDGSVRQHYPFTASCWASGSAYPNTHFIAAENGGGPPWNVSEPLTEAQVAANVRVIKELLAWSASGGWQPRRPTDDGDLSATLYEHRECVRFGSDPTACPSGRIAWPAILERLGEEEQDKVVRLIRASDSVFTYATDGIHKWYIPNPQVLRQLQDAGVLPSEVKVLPPEAVAAIPRVD